MDLDPVPGKVKDAAPQVDPAIRVAIVGQVFHRLQIVIVIPRAVRIIHMILVEQVFVVVKGQRAVIFWQTVLLPIPFLKSTILDRVPILDRALIQVRFDVWAQV